jgi:transposase
MAIYRLGFIKCNFIENWYYGEIQEWITQKCQVVVSYKTVHKIVRYKFNAKLKVPRPRSAQAKPEVQAAFKKNFPK